MTGGRHGKGMCKYMTEKMTGFCIVEYRDKWGAKHIIITTCF